MTFFPQEVKLRAKAGKVMQMVTWKRQQWILGTVQRGYSVDKCLSFKQKCFAELVSTLSMVMDMEENIKLSRLKWPFLLIMASSRYANRWALRGSFMILVHWEWKTILCTDNEQGLFRQSQNTCPSLGAAVIMSLNGKLPYMWDHHERWDGKGYPAGKDREISGGGQVIPGESLIFLSAIRNPDIKKYGFFGGLSKAFSDLIYEAALEVLGDIPFVAAMVANNLRYYIQIPHPVRGRSVVLTDQQGRNIYQYFADINDAKHAYTGDIQAGRRIFLYIGRVLNIGSLFINLYKAAYCMILAKWQFKGSLMPGRLGSEFHIVSSTRTYHWTA